MIKDLTIFASSICNLRCSYCYIKKDQAVFDYDTKLVDALKSGEYIKRIKKDFPESVNTLENLQAWGAEPSIHLDLLAEKLKDFKMAFPKLNSFRMSSNYTYVHFFENVSNMINAMSEFPDTHWTYSLQCSIDGTEDVNDINRGSGTTKLIIDNLNKIKEIELPDNVTLIIRNKATISKESFDKFVNYDYCENYFLFLKNLFSCSDKKKDISAAPPTCVDPDNYTKEDGEKFSKIIDNFIKISKKYNYRFIPYIKRKEYKLSEWTCGGLCGHCHASVIILPDDKYASCHRSAFDIIPSHYETRKKEFKEIFNRDLVSIDNWVGDINTYRQLESNMQKLYTTKSKMFFSEFYNTAKILCDIGEISSVYKNREILKEHIKLFIRLTICMQASIDLTGSYFCCASYFIPLFFNGAMAQIYDYLNEKKYITKEDK